MAHRAAVRAASKMPMLPPFPAAAGLPMRTLCVLARRAPPSPPLAAPIGAEGPSRLLRSPLGGAEGFFEALFFDKRRVSRFALALS